jgi:hypothetical protein
MEISNRIAYPFLAVVFLIAAALALAGPIQRWSASSRHLLPQSRQGSIGGKSITEVKAQDLKRRCDKARAAADLAHDPQKISIDEKYWKFRTQCHDDACIEKLDKLHSAAEQEILRQWLQNLANACSD